MYVKWTHLDSSLSCCLRSLSSWFQPNSSPSPDGEKDAAKKKKEESVKLPPIDGKKKKEGNKKKDEYPEHVVIMDAEDINKAIEGAYRQYY